jgi:hypothetical protein
VIKDRQRQYNMLVNTNNTSIRQLKKKYLLLSLLFAVLGQTFGQSVFLPNVGTKWNYRFGNYSYPQEELNYQVTYLKDTLYNNETVKVITSPAHHQNCTYFNKRIFFKQQNDSIFFMSQKTSFTWQLLINYGATAGQSWTLSLLNKDNNTVLNYTITVNAVSSVTINNTPLKTLQVTYKGPFMSTYSSTIYERFGDILFLFNFYQIEMMSACDYNHAQDILCYEDSSFGLKQFTSYPCNYSNLLGIKKISLENTPVFLYPNPVSSKAIITTNELDLAGSRLTLVNPLGQTILETNYEKEIDLSYLKPGLYFLLVDTKQGTKKVRLVKE